MTPDKQHRKCAGVIGEVLKSYHPHGDSVGLRRARTYGARFHAALSAVDGHGNFGSIDPDPPAAYRYTEARLARAVARFAGRHRQRDRRLHSQLRQSRRRADRACRAVCRSCSSTVRAASRSAWRRTSRRTISARSATRSSQLIDDPEAERRRDGRHRQRPRLSDRRTMLLGREAIREAYKTGPRFGRRCAARPRSSKKRASYRSSSPSCRTKSTNRRIMRSDHRSALKRNASPASRASTIESNRKGMNDRRRPAAHARPRTSCSTSSSSTRRCSRASASTCWRSCRSRRDGSRRRIGNALEPQVLSLQQTARALHRPSQDRRHAAHALRSAQGRRARAPARRLPHRARQHRRSHRDRAREPDDRRSQTRASSARFSLTDVQAQAIVDMRLRTLVGLERQKIEDEYAELLKTIAELQDILAQHRAGSRRSSRARRSNSKKRYGDARRTTIEAARRRDLDRDIIAEHRRRRHRTRSAATSSACRSTRSARKTAAAAA